MTPQQLMDMRGAGNAEKWLRENGKWRFTPQEKLDEALQSAYDAIDDAQKWLYNATSAFDKMEANP